MPMSDAPLNGFTGFGRRDPSFESVSDALRQTERETDGWTRQREGAKIQSRNEALGDPGRSGPLGGADAVSKQYRSAPYREPFGSYGPALSFAESLRGEDPNGFDGELLARVPGYDRRWAWVEIDLDAIAANVRAIRGLLKPSTRLMAVVKADAYGHGALRSAEVALAAGAERLGIATIDEGIALRVAGVRAPIELLEEPPLTSIPLLLHYEITPSIYTTEFAIAYAEIASSLGRPGRYHLAVNTGMNRVGVRYDDVVEFLEAVNFHRGLELEGTFTHFATADMHDTLDFQSQVRRFNEALRSMRGAGFNPGIVSAANSAATIRYPEVQYDMVRPGIVLYGHHPCSETTRLVELRPAMEVHARVSDVRSVPVSEGVGYGLGYRSPGSVRICTIPLGYGDGLHRVLSGNFDVLLDGRRCHQVGSICMDQCMFEVNMRSFGLERRLDPHIGDEVVIVGRQGDEFISLEELAREAGTISYELAIAFGTSRLPRLYRSS